LAERLEERFGDKVELIESKDGEFTVWLGEALVAGKSNGMFPEFDKVLESMASAVELKEC